MRTNNPSLSTGCFRSSAPAIVQHTFARSPSASISQTHPSRPSHKRHAIPRIFHPIHHHSRLPRNLRQLHLSQRIIDSVDHAFQHGWGDSTLANYGSTVDRFLAFCTGEGVPIKFQLPADEFVLCAFAASSAGIHAGSTARNNIAALKAWHIAQNAEWRGGARLHYILAGVEQLAPESSRRPPRPPINSTMLRVLYDGLDFSNPRDVAVFAAACVAFWGQCRLGELLPISSSSHASKYLPTRQHLSKSSRNKRSTILRLPRTKTKIQGEDVTLVAQSAPLDPRTALDMHLIANKCGDSTSLFTYTSLSGPTILTKPKFLARCNEIWTRAGYPRTTGHSFRIGGTTELLLAGVPPDVVKALGRWSSNSFLRYWRSLEELAPIHAEFIRSI
ncbi:DNA breaking-rejoining enzyme [Mycena latifolia]|nr:DNA breaking-rejoining enzyme [Mycena latifolia]